MQLLLIFLLAMTFTINYQKRKNINLFNKFNSLSINLTNVQNYIPIYDRFFTLNNTNYNSINLNNSWTIYDIKESKNNLNDNVFMAKIKHINNEENEDTSVNQLVFIKMAPLLDPYKYLVGKYNHTCPNLFNLPSLDKSIQVHPKIAEQNNSSYVDSFFCFLSSQLLNKHKFIHAIDFYGSFLAIKNDFKVNIYDDLDYLIQTDFFNKNQNILFTVDNYDYLLDAIQPEKLKPINISTTLKSALSIKSFDENIYENIFEKTNQISLDDIKNTGSDLVDITNSNSFNINNQNKSHTIKTNSTCSSRTSHTNSHDDYESDNENEYESNDEHANKSEQTNNTDKTSDNNSETSFETDITGEDEEEYDEDDEVLYATIPKFPVQVICLENCVSTLHEFIISDEYNEDELLSALMQVIMTLITYQKVFSFTHNDLHANNVMYINTNTKFIYYTYKKKTYKVPTYGKIFKIIDFGRSIYKFDKKIFCSDSFQNGGDASTQYNTEPFYNENKPRLEPNYSFDLCRLACSIFDYLIDDLDNIKELQESSNIIKLIVEWCKDDNGNNILYKANKVERYPDFKLYKMIARCVHNHTPNAQLDRPEFSKYIISAKNIPKNVEIINIDLLPCYS